MKAADPELLKRIEKLIQKMQGLAAEADTPEAKNSFDYALKCLAALAEAAIHGRPVFGVEPWHLLNDKAPLDAPGEMLLRLKDAKGEALAPYPMVMAFYQNGLTAEIDTILVLSALAQFEAGEERQASVNVSARSLLNPDFVKTAATKIENLDLEPGRKIILEIHESTPSLVMNQKVLSMFRKAGALFAIDDVGMHISDVMRLSEFDGIADFIKLDRQSVNASPGSANSLDHVIAFVAAMLPGAVIIAEGVKSAEHAQTLLQHHPDISYAQGLYLPGRAEFAAEWKKLTGPVKAASARA